MNGKDELQSRVLARGTAGQFRLLLMGLRKTRSDGGPFRYAGKRVQFLGSRAMKSKAILVLAVAVFGMASPSRATTVRLADEGMVIHATPGSNVRLTISTDAPLVVLDAVITVTGGDFISTAINKSDCAAYGWDPSISYNPLGVGTPSVEIGLVNSLGNSNTIVGYVDVTYTSGVRSVSVAPGSSFGGSVDMNYIEPAFSTGVVTVIPEPMTVVLLGLGVVMLRRKRYRGIK